MAPPAAASGGEAKVDSGVENASASQQSSLWDPIAIPEHGPLGTLYFPAVASVGSKVFVFGGKNGSLPSAKSSGDTYQFDPVLLQWTLCEQTEAPPARNACSFVLTEDESEILMFGGVDGNVTFNDVWSFDVASRQWSRMRSTGDRPKPVSHHSAVLHNGFMYVYGGWAVEWGRGEKMHRYELRSGKWDAITFAKGVPVPERRFSHVATVHNEKMFVFGGSKSVGPTNEMWQFSFITNKWEQLPQRGPWPSPRKQLAAVQLDDCWLIHGGCVNEDQILDNAWEYKFASEKWIQAAPFSTEEPLEGHACVKVSREFTDGLVLIGGRCNKTEIENDIRMVAVARPQAVGDYGSQMDGLRRAIEELTVGAPPVDTLAALMRPVVEHRKAYGEKLEVEVEETTAAAQAAVAQTGESPGAQAASENVFFLSKVVGAVAEETCQVDGVEAEDAWETVEKAKTKLKTFMQSILEDPGDSIALVDGGDLTEGSLQTLEQIGAPLKELEDNARELWDKFIEPSLVSIRQEDADRAAVLMKKQKEKLEELLDPLRDISFELTDVKVPMKGWKATQSQMVNAIEVLKLLSENRDALTDQLNEPPISLDVSTSQCKAGMQSFCEHLQTKEAEYDDKLKTVRDTLAEVKAKQTAMAEQSEEVVAAFRERQRGYQSKRQEIIDDLNEYVAKAMASLKELVDEEVTDLLTVEKKMREDVQVQRQVAKVNRTFKQPVQLCERLQATYKAGREFAEAFHGDCLGLLDRVQRHSVKSAQAVAVELINQKERLPVFAKEVIELLQKELDRHERTVKRLEGRIEAKRQKLELLEDMGDAAELASDDDAEASEEANTNNARGGVNRRTAPTDTVIKEALGGADDIVTGNSPYHQTLTKYHSEKQLLERALTEIETLKEQMNEVEEIQTNFLAKQATLESQQSDDVAAESLLGLLLHSGADWEAIAAEARENQKVPPTEWVEDCFAADPEKYKLQKSERETAVPPQTLAHSASTSGVTRGAARLATATARGGARGARGGPLAATIGHAPRGAPNRSSTTPKGASLTARQHRPGSPVTTTTPPPLSARFSNSTLNAPSPTMGDRRGSANIAPAHGSRFGGAGAGRSTPSFGANKTTTATAKRAPKSATGGATASTSPLSARRGAEGGPSFARATSNATAATTSTPGRFGGGGPARTSVRAGRA